MTADTIEHDTLKIVSWNLGYAGLGDDMDFFYDGGTSVQCSKERTRENLDSIISFLTKHRDADFILLQEVDFDSKRSYHMNEYDSIRNALPEFFGWWGLDYVCSYVPIPLTDPIGSVRSGVVILSRYVPHEVIRFQYPGEFAFPARIFNLKRCLLSATFNLSGTGNMLYINNTHNSAYDTDGGMRSGEMQFLRDYLQGKPCSITAGDWNSNPPGYVASTAELTDAHFKPATLRSDEFTVGWNFMYDSSTPTTRYGYETYNPSTTTSTILDFALCGTGIKPIAIKTVDLSFKSSDHNPIVLEVALVRDNRTR